MRKIKVLVVDDSALMRNLVSKIINSSPNLTVVATAMNGKFALEKIPQCNPDIIVLDVEMPVMNGIRTLELIRKRPDTATIPVIFLTASADRGSVVEACRLEAVDYVIKPVVPRDLCLRVDKVLNG